MTNMTIDASELARQLAARRKPRAVVCPICGTQAIGVGRRKYCSEQCAKRAWWRRHRGKAAQLGQDAAAVQRWEDDGGALGLQGPRGDAGAVGLPAARPGRCPLALTSEQRGVPSARRMGSSPTSKCSVVIKKGAVP